MLTDPGNINDDAYFISLAQCDTNKECIILIKDNYHYVGGINDIYDLSKIHIGDGTAIFLKCGMIKLIWYDQIYIMDIYDDIDDSQISICKNEPSENSKISYIWNKTMKYIDNLEPIFPYKYYVYKYVSTFSFKEYHSLFGKYFDIIINPPVAKTILMCLKFHNLYKNIKYYILDFIIFNLYNKKVGKYKLKE